MIVVITSGAHWRNVHVPDEETRQFAHIFDPDSPEGVPVEAHNFITYATALGKSLGPHILLRPEEEWAEPEADQLEVMLSDWQNIVETATRIAVEIR
jgi:hypothetical protein